MTALKPPCASSRCAPNASQEYDDPLDRRFHAQPNACPQCGPSLALVDSSGNVMAGGGDAIQTASELLKAGRIIALRGLGVFQLACDATNELAVNLLRSRGIC